MRMEFFKPAPGIFTETTFFRELGSDKYIPVSSLDENKQRIIYMLFIDNKTIAPYIKYLKQRGIDNMLEVISMCIVRYFPKLNKTWDIDGNNLNIETN
jgi:hypothetical protein